MTTWAAPTLRGYRRPWLAADAVAGLTLVAVAVPAQIATARLAGMPAITGLYAFVAGSLLYALLGTNPHVSVGADSTIAPVLATGVAAVAAVGTARYAMTMAFTAVLVGAVLVAIGASRLGWISEFLSTPVVTGVLAGIAVEIVVRQLPSILGVSAGGGTPIGRLRQLGDHLAHTNGWSLGIGLGVLAIIVGGRRLDRRLPGALLALVVSIAAVDAFGLAAHHGVAVLGTVHGGLPSIRWPSASWSALHQLIGPVLTVSFVCVAQTAATLRIADPDQADAGDFGRDLISVGAGSIIAGVIGAFAVDASPPNTEIVAGSGGRTQLAHTIAAAVVLVVALVATAPLSNLPQATLGATLVYIASKLLGVRELRAILRFNRIEFGLATASLAVVAFIGIEQGVAVALVLSLAERTWRSARPIDVVLGREVGTDHWVPVDIGRPTEQLPGILVYLVYAPLWYGNADYLRDRVRRLVSDAPTPLHALILDANAMSDIDYTGLQVLRTLITELRQQGITLGIARASHLVHRELKHGALLAEVGPDHLFSSVAEAVAAFPTR